MTTPTTVNREYFQKILDLTIEYPELHNQESWEAPPEHTGRCGTTRCIAGWAVWLKAHELGLLSQKRDRVNRVMLYRVAEAIGVGTSDIYATDRLYVRIGSAILGLSVRDGRVLFLDMSNERTLARLKSYAERGHDLTPDEIAAWI